MKIPLGLNDNNKKKKNYETTNKPFKSKLKKNDSKVITIIIIK
jgi:hypothetical protein